MWHQQTPWNDYSKWLTSAECVFASTWLADHTSNQNSWFKASQKKEKNEFTDRFILTNDSTIKLEKYMKKVMPVLIHQVAAKLGVNQLTIDANGISYGIFKLNI